MDNIELNLKWDKIVSSININGYKALRVTSTCLPDLFIAVDDEGYRCLLFYLPQGSIVKINGKNKDKLLLSYIPDKSVLLIKLKDFDFIDLFNDLILSIYSKVHAILDAEEAYKEFITTFYKWSLFFEDSNQRKFGEEQIQGLFGELFVLNDYVSQSDPSNINRILASWKGLYDSRNDFEFELKNVEVKTKRENKRYVKISSEFQLEQEFGKGQELLVVSVVKDLTNGKSIEDLIKIVVQQTRNKLGDLGFIYQALSQKGLTVNSVKEYNNYRFIVKNISIYDCNALDFPKLSASNIPYEIVNLNYDLMVNKLREFLIEERKY